MHYKEIEGLFQSDDGIEVLLDQYAPIFHKIEEYQEMFKDGHVHTTADTDKVMKELTGLFMNLNIVCAVAVTEYETKEVVTFNRRKMDVERSDEKVIASVIRQATLESIAPYSRVKNLFVAYRDSCDKAISVCQSSLKSMDREKLLSR